MFHCPVLASASLFWVVSLLLVPVWLWSIEPEPGPPSSTAVWLWSTVWSVQLPFPAVASVSAWFD